MLNLKEVFEKYEDEFMKFERIENPRHPVRDVCGFIMLDEIAPKFYQSEQYKHQRENMVAWVKHDQIWLTTNTEELANKATEEQIRDLLRCGVFYDSDTESLSMFV